MVAGGSGSNGLILVIGQLFYEIPLEIVSCKSVKFVFVILDT